ncbi:hypothetical protein ACJX0J_026533, partial [Zea mays]
VEFLEVLFNNLGSLHENFVFLLQCLELSNFKKQERNYHLSIIKLQNISILYELHLLGMIGPKIILPNEILYKIGKQSRQEYHGAASLLLGQVAGNLTDMFIPLLKVIDVNLLFLTDMHRLLLVLVTFYVWIKHVIDKILEITVRRENISMEDYKKKHVLLPNSPKKSADQG